MRYASFAAAFGVLAVACAMTSAEPFKMDAASKVQGNMTGRSFQQGNTYRSYSYAPATAGPSVAPQAPANTESPVAKSAEKTEKSTRSFSKEPQKDATATRSFSVEPQPTYAPSRTYRTNQHFHRFLHADNKVRGGY
jgi:hypothetical protein